MEQSEHASGKALTARSALIALSMALLWTVACCYISVQGAVQPQQLLMVLGFAALLTVFLLRFPTVFLVSQVLLWGLTWALMYFQADPLNRARVAWGIARSLLVAGPMLALGVWVRRRPLARGELAVIYATVLIAVPSCIAVKSVIESSTANLFELQRRTEPQVYAWAKEMPWWGPTIPTGQGPPDAEAVVAVEGFTKGNGGRVPWGLWWRPLTYWTGMCLAFEAMLMGLVLLLRRRWIEQERLPFVWSEPALEILNGPQTRAENRRRWIMFAIGLGLCLPGIVLMTSAGASWKVPPWVGIPGLRGGVDLTAMNILPKVQLRLWWGPLVLAMLLLFPADVLMTAALTYIFFNILAPGLMRVVGMDAGSWNLWGFVRWGLRFGGCAGLLIWTVFFALWDRLRARRTGEVELAPGGDGGIPQKLVLAVFLVGAVGFVALGCYATSLVQMLVLTALVLIYGFAQVRQRAEGMPLTYDSAQGSIQIYSIQRDYLHNHYKLPGNDVAQAGKSWATHWMQWGFAGQLKAFGPHNMVLEAFKVGHELRVHARSIGLAVLAAVILTALVTPVLYVQLMYVYGFENSYQGMLGTWNSFTEWSGNAANSGVNSAWSIYRINSDSFYKRYKNIFWAFYGVAIVGGLFYLRREHPRFPLSPVGMVIGAERFWEPHVPFSPALIWFSFLVAWIAKVLIFRWLGVRSFREKVRPALIMLLCGMIFGMMAYLCRCAALGIGLLR